MILLLFRRLFFKFPIHIHLLLGSVKESPLASLITCVRTATLDLVSVVRAEITQVTIFLVQGLGWSTLSILLLVTVQDKEEVEH